MDETQGMNDELAPCPFCAGNMVIHGQLFRHEVEPEHGKCPIRQNAWAVEMIDVWNTRAALSAFPLEELVGALRAFKYHARLPANVNRSSRVTVPAHVYHQIDAALERVSGLTGLVGE